MTLAFAFLARQLRRWSMALAVLLAVASLTGCAWKGGPVPDETGTSGDEAGAWTPSPVKMRVYPSSKFVTTSGQTVFEARIELLDEMGDSTKGVGRFRFELLVADQGGRAEQGKLLYGWNLPLLTLAEQKKYYDPITRAYLFRLKLDSPIPRHETTMLRALLTPPSGPRLQAQETIKPAGANP